MYATNASTNATPPQLVQFDDAPAAFGSAFPLVWALHGPEEPSSASSYVARLSADAPCDPPLRPLAFLCKKLAFGVSSHVLRIGAPTVCSAEAWAVKNTMLAAQTLLLAATAAGLSSCPMEGFDGRRVRRALRIPRRYSIPLVVAVGHPTPLARDDPVATKRFALEEVAFGDAFGEPLLAAASG